MIDWAYFSATSDNLYSHGPSKTAMLTFQFKESFGTFKGASFKETPLRSPSCKWTHDLWITRHAVFHFATAITSQAKPNISLEALNSSIFCSAALQVNIFKDDNWGWKRRRTNWSRGTEEDSRRFDLIEMRLRERERGRAWERKLKMLRESERVRDEDEKRERESLREEVEEKINWVIKRSCSLMYVCVSLLLVHNSECVPLGVWGSICLCVCWCIIVSVCPCVCE